MIFLEITIWVFNFLPGSDEGEGGEPLFWGREEQESVDWELLSLFICFKVKGESERLRGRRGIERGLKGIVGLDFSRAVAAAVEEEELFRRREGIESSMCGRFESREKDK